mgnify:FL=1|jgi:hypothetical protein
MKWVRNNIIILTIIILVGIIAKPVIADSTNDDNDQTNTSGSNTQITGGYTATTTNNNDGQTNTTTSTTTNTTTTNGSDVPVNSANSPSFSAMSQDVCSTGISGSVSTLGLGISAGKHVRDLNCERIKLSKVLFDYGMKVAAVSILCQDERVFSAMAHAGTPCPFEGKIGKEALEQWNKYDIERPDYDSYVSKLDNRSKIDEELAEIARQEEAEILRLEQEAIAKKIAKEKAKLETLKQEEEVNNIIIETELQTKEVKTINIHK